MNTFSIFQTMSPDQALAREKTFLSKTYGWMSVGLLISGLSAWYISISPKLIELFLQNNIMFFGLVILEFALVMGIGFGMSKISATTALMLFLLYSAVNGITLSVVLLVYTLSSVFSVFLITAGMFGAMAILGTVIKKDLTVMGQFLFMALIGLLIASLVNIFMQSSQMDWLISIAGIFIFTGLTLYDANKLKRLSRGAGEIDEENLNKLSIFGALQLYLDFINLFLMLLRMFGRKD